MQPFGEKAEHEHDAIGAEAYALELRDITKSFPGVRALVDVSVRIAPGDVHGLIGENGAGKTTLMKIAYGFHKPDAGSIRIGGQEVELSSPRHALELGIGMVHQHSLLVESMTVTENLMLGRFGGPKRLPRRRVAAELSAIIEKHKLKLDPLSRVADLGVAARQRVEILRSLYERAHVLILDEPTAVLTPQEAEQLFEDFEHYRQLGTTIVLITHKLPEVMRITDKVTVLRKGKVVEEEVTTKTNPEKLATAMVGQGVDLRAPRANRGGLENADARLKVEAISTPASNQKVELKNVSFGVAGGEIFGVAGIDGNGTTELVECLAGLIAPIDGVVWLDGQDITGMSVAERRDLGLRHIPEDRLDRGASPLASLAENLILGRHRWEPISNGALLDVSYVRRFAEERIEVFNISTPGPDALAGQLSGGNLQKAIVAREIDTECRVLLAAQPTRGVDVGAISFIRKELVKLCERGVAVVLVSAELSDLIDLSDRIAVFYEGRIAGVVSGPEMTENRLGQLMAGMVLE